MSSINPPVFEFGIAQATHGWPSDLPAFTWKAEETLQASSQTTGFANTSAVRVAPVEIASPVSLDTISSSDYTPKSEPNTDKINANEPEALETASPLTHSHEEDDYGDYVVNLLRTHSHEMDPGFQYAYRTLLASLMEVIDEKSRLELQYMELCELRNNDSQNLSQLHSKAKELQEGFKSLQGDFMDQAADIRYLTSQLEAARSEIEYLREKPHFTRIQDRHASSDNPLHWSGIALENLPVTRLDAAALDMDLSDCLRRFTLIKQFDQLRNAFQGLRPHPGLNGRGSGT